MGIHTGSSDLVLFLSACVAWPGCEIEIESDSLVEAQQARSIVVSDAMPTVGEGACAKLTEITSPLIELSSDGVEECSGQDNACSARLSAPVLGKKVLGPDMLVWSHVSAFEYLSTAQSRVHGMWDHLMDRTRNGFSGQCQAMGGIPCIEPINGRMTRSGEQVFGDGPDTVLKSGNSDTPPEA